MVTKIVVNLELGHVAKTLDVPTLTGHTHEWVMFVKGADKMLIEHFVEKVVFWLHDSYVPPKVVVKYPPFQVKQSGYAGFNILIDIHFKNKSEPKSVRFHYDLFLHKENMPPVNHTRVEMLTFTNPAEDFKKRLIKAGGIVKTQESNPKEKKSHKDIRHSEEKQSRSSKEKYEGEKPRHKAHHGESKSSKSSSSSAGDEKRRSSVSDEFVQKRKHEEKTSVPASRPSGEPKSKEKDKVTKVKIKTEPSSSMSSLFSIDDSIHVKQIKQKKEASSHDSRKDKEKRPESKVKKEVLKQEYSEKKIRKQSPVVQKTKPMKEAKVKRPRPVSSSDESDIIQKTSAILAQSDSDTDTNFKKKKKKRSKPDKMKKLMKRSKNTPEKVVKHTPPPTRIATKDVPSAPERPKTPQNTEKPVVKPPKQHRKTSESSYVSERKPKPQPAAPEKTKSNPSFAKVASKSVQRSSTPTIKKEKHSSIRGSTPVRNVEAPVREKKTNPPPPPRIPMKEKRIKKVESSSESSSSSSSNNSSDDEMDMSPIKDVAVPKHVVSPLSPMSSSDSDAPSSEVPSFTMHPEEPEHLLDNPHVDPPQPIDDIHAEESESDHEEAFAQDTTTDQMDTTGSLETSEEKHFDEPESPKEPPMNKQAVTVGVGDLNYYPHMNDELFEKLRQLQILLSTLTDETRIRKISSIVRKSGNFTQEDDNMMNFDFCSLDRRTIHRIEKHLKVTGDK